MTGRPFAGRALLVRGLGLGRRVSRSAGLLAIAGSLALGSTLAVGLPGASLPPASAAEDPGTNITVQVTAPGQAPASSSPGATGAPRGSTTTTTRSTDTGSVVVTSDTNPPAPGEGEYSLGGVLYLSGLSTEYQPSVNPFNGEMVAHFTVRNVSTETIDSSARFWITNPFGGEISSVDPVSITGLKPNESTTIDATLPGVGQWTFVTAHVTLTPPASVGGVDLQPFTRDAVVFLPPWWLLVLAGLGALLYAALRVWRYVTAPQLVGATA